MRYIQLLENADYNIARKQYQKLSPEARELLDNWGQIGSSSLFASLNDDFKTRTPEAQEIWKAGEPIRENIRARSGNSITLYRGIFLNKKINPSRILFSWTSSKKVAQSFAGKEESNSMNNKFISDRDVENAIKTFNKNGVLSFLGLKYIKDTKDPDFFKTYYKYKNRLSFNGRFSNDFLKTHFIEAQKTNNKHIERLKDLDIGRIIQKHIPVDDVIWVMMQHNENEYIVKDIQNEIHTIIRE